MRKPVRAKSDRGSGDLDQSSGAILRVQPLDWQAGERIAIQRLGRPLLEEFIVEKLSDRFLVRPTGQRQSSIPVRGLARVLLRPIVQKSVAGPGVERKKLIVTADPRHIGNPADIDESDRTFLERAGQCAVIGRHKRRSFASRGNIGSTKVIDERLVETAREQWAITKLHGQVLLRAMDDRLAMKPDKVDLGIRQTAFTAERLDRRDMPFGERPFDCCKLAGPSMAVAKRLGQFDRIAKHPSLIGLKSITARWSPMNDIVAVGLDERNIDAVERGTRHEAEA